MSWIRKILGKEKSYLPDFKLTPPTPPKSKSVEDCDRMNRINDALENGLTAIKLLQNENDNLKQQIRDLKYYHAIETSKLQQSYRVQFEWIEQNHPEVYKQIPK